MSNNEREDANTVALTMLARAYYALTILYEEDGTPEHNYFERRVVSRLVDSMRADGTCDIYGDERMLRALDRVRSVLADAGADVAAIRSQVLTRR
jgi:hypothetical protein